MSFLPAIPAENKVDADDFIRCMAFAIILVNLAKLVRERAYRRLIDQEDVDGRDTNDTDTDNPDGNIHGGYSDERNVDILRGIALVLRWTDSLWPLVVYILQKSNCCDMF